MTRLGLVLGATALVVLGGAAAAYAFVVRAGPNPARGTIAFIGTDGQCNGRWTGGGKLFLVPARGGARQPFLPARSGVDPSWSPDGRSLAFADFTCGAELRSGIAVADSQGRHVRVVTTGPADSKPTWSPDGKTIAFLRQAGLNKRLFTVPAGGGQPRPLGTPRAVSGLSWSPDGRSLVIAHDFPRTKVEGGIQTSVEPMGLDVLRADGTGLHGLTGGKVIDRAPAWSPDGHWIAFVREHHHNAGLGGSDWIPDGLYFVHPDGSGLHRLADAYLDPAWSPDSKYVVGSSLDRPTSEHPHAGLSLHVLRARGLLAGTRFREWVATPRDGRDIRPTWKAQ